jgi:hypothetical protein
MRMSAPGVLAETAVAPPRTARRASGLDLTFAAFFGVYTAAAIALLLLGLGSVLAQVYPQFQGTLHAWAQAGGGVAPWALGVEQASHASSGARFVALDYLLSALNLVFGVFLVRIRPGEWVARLLGVGMVGTAAAFNFQAHDVLTTLPGPARDVHLALHLISGMAYLHALLLFPNGRLAGGWALWLLRVLYLITGLDLIASTLFGASLVGFYFMWAFGLPLALDQFPILVRAETLFFVVFFGLLSPAVGVGSQLRRYRSASTDLERRQTKLIVWALAVAFGAGMLFLALVSWLGGAVAASPAPGAAERVERWVFQFMPLLLAVIPAVLFISILRYRLWGLDGLINRTLVYVPLTGIFAGLFAALSKLLEMGFVWLTGDRSDAAVVITALVLAGAFTPLKSGLQTVVDRYFKEAPDPMRNLRTFDAHVRSVAEVIDVEQLSRRFLEESVTAFGAEYGTVSLLRNGGARLEHDSRSEETPQAGVDSSQAGPTVEIPFEDGGVRLGVLSLGPRRGGSAYEEEDLQTLRETAGRVARVAALLDGAGR